MAQRNQQFETDAIRPTGLSSTIAPQHRVDDKLNSAEYLDAVEEEWNKRVDAEVETLVGGMQDLVELATVGDKDKHRIYEDAFETELRAENMVRAAHSLLSIVHSLKLMILLSDEGQVVERRQKELTQIVKETEAAKERAAEEWRKLVDGEEAEEPSAEGEAAEDDDAMEE
ncbi:hypothetical protein CALCODRAFT_483001 [Calocera cornea HHB12733]|uniref:Mediator of RNA polymerase II transcription subunit 22 n=1 Tax=Calocera cornea HHB12733 TaxID=1353952 RepID=A0A165G6Z3_9BASI|nr:hypothetical protein CALCODRAFT_483001 [Calocera cornea HHB12733]